MIIFFGRETGQKLDVPCASRSIYLWQNYNVKYDRLLPKPKKTMLLEEQEH